MTARLPKLLALLAIVLAATASSGSAASRAHPRMLGVVPHGSATATHALSKARALRAAAPSSLTFDANYETLIDQYFTDVAADSAKTTNVYSVATQYYDTVSGPQQHVQYQSAFGGSAVVHDPLPANGCDDAHNGLHDPYCLTDQQLQTEIQNVLTAKNWSGGLDHMFFLMTPNGVGSCEDATNSACSTNAFCAYHFGFGTFAEPVIYANEPYMGPLPPGECTNAVDQGFPNNDVDAETTINTISHEHNEAITDPLGDAWFADDASIGMPGDENGDLCAYGFGTQLGGTPGTTAWNQVINKHHYELQQEWTNENGGGCVRFRGDTPPGPATTGTGPLVYHGGPVMRTNTAYAIYWLPTAGNTSPPVVTGKAVVNQTLTTSAGSWTGAPSSHSYQWQRCSASGTGCVNISGATATTYELTSADGGHTVRSTVGSTNVNGASAPAASAVTAVVIDVPAETKAPHISGRARVGRKLTASHGSWTYSPTGYRYQWLRCNAHGGSCARIGRATRSRYKLTKRDAKHRLRVRVTAVNLAGSTVALSAATARVPAPKR